MKRSYGGITTTYIFSGTKPLAEYIGGTVTREYIYSGQTQLAEIAYSGLNVSVTYKYPDHLSTRDETDASGNLTRTFGHLPFGENWYETGTSSKWKFTTYERDSETNNDYATFRHYENRLGRFMTTDPYGGSTNPLIPQTWNRFTYVYNDPTRLSDPLGLGVDCWATVLIERNGSGAITKITILAVWCYNTGNDETNNGGGTVDQRTGVASEEFTACVQEQNKQYIYEISKLKNMWSVGELFKPRWPTIFTGAIAGTTAVWASGAKGLLGAVSGIATGLSVNYLQNVADVVERTQPIIDKANSEFNRNVSNNCSQYLHPAGNQGSN